MPTNDTEPGNEDIAMVPEADTPTAETTPEEQVAAVQADWNQFRAKHNLHVDGVLAFVAGAAVPSSHPWRETWEQECALLKVGA